MPSSSWLDDSAEDLDPREYPDEDDFDFHDDSSDLISCPQCESEIHEESPKCPVCGYYIIDRTSLWTGRPVWWIMLGLLGIFAVTFALAFGQ